MIIPYDSAGGVLVRAHDMHGPCCIGTATCHVPDRRPASRSRLMKSEKEPGPDWLGWVHVAAKQTVATQRQGVTRETDKQ